MKPIRILHMSGTMNIGGAENLLMELYRHIDRDKVQFDFMIYNYSNSPGFYDDEIRSLGGHIYSMRGMLKKNPVRYLVELKHFFDKHKEYQIVHAHQYATSGYVLAMAKISEKKRITIAHSHVAHNYPALFRRISNAIGKKLLSLYADYYIGCSKDALISLNNKKSDESTCMVMKNAIDIEKFYYNEKQRISWRTTFDIDDATFVIGNVARFTEEKNHEFIIMVFSMLKRRIENSRLVLIGTGHRVNRIKALVKTLNLENSVIFMGERTDVNEIINAFDLYIMPSKFEGLGITLIEAQANGLSCIISKDVIPEEADVRGGMIKRVSLSESPERWAEECISAAKRKDASFAQQAVKLAGYDINEVALNLQNFYLNNWSTHN